MENAKLYASANSMQRTDAEEALVQYISDISLKAGARVLDVGCGSGDVTVEVLLPRLPSDLDEVIGIDLSEEMIAHARNHYSKPQLSFFQLSIDDDEEAVEHFLKQLLKQNNNLEVFPKNHVEICVNDVKIDSLNDCTNGSNDSKNNCNELSARDSNGLNLNEINKNNKDKLSDLKLTTEMDPVIENLKFDLIFSFYCLHWVQNQRQALNNMYTMLKPNGEALLVFLAKAPIFTMYENLAKETKWSPYMQDVSKFISPYHHSEDGATEFSNLATSIGFNVVTVECQEKRYIYRELGPMKDALRAISPFIPRLPEHEVDHFTQDSLQIVRRLKLATKVDDGFEVQYNLLIAHLRK